MVSFVLQAIFKHFFTRAMDDISRQVNLKGCFSLEFEDDVPFCTLHIRFWKDQYLARVQLCRFGSANPFPVGHLGVIARVMSVLSTRPNIVSCSGCPITILRALDSSEYTDKTTQYPFRFDSLSFHALMSKCHTDVFGSLDFYSVLQYLIVYLGGAQHQSWFQLAPDLMKVCIWFTGASHAGFEIT